MGGPKSTILQDADPYIQSLLDAEMIIQGKLQQLQQDLNSFQTFYLETTWRTGNIYVGWPKVSFPKIEEFMNKGKLKKSYQLQISADQYQKIFSISSVSSKPFSLMSQLNYTANKSVECQSRPKISKRFKKKKIQKAQQSLDTSDRFQLSIKQSIKQVNQIDQVEQQQDEVEQQQDEVRNEINQVPKYKKNKEVKGDSNQSQKDS